MKATHLKSKPVWLESARPHFTPLKTDRAFDVVVIGGGITGLTTAYLLKQIGQRVAVFEKGRIGDAETGHTTAHLTYVTDTRLSTLVDTFGREGAALAWHAGATAIRAIEEITRRENIDCHFRHVPGFLTAAITKDRDEADELRSEAELAANLGFPASFLPRVPLVDRPGICFSNQALIHAIEYLAGLARAIEGDGCEIHELSEMTEVHDDPLTVVAEGHRVTCARIVVATHVPLLGLNNLLSGTLFQSKLAGYSTYAIGAAVPQGSVPVASFWDTDDPYYYLRVDRREDDEYVILGGEDHRTGQQEDTEERYARLESVLLHLLPQATLDHRWSGQVIETPDGLPYIGPVNDRQFIATGFAGNGLTFGTLSGMMARDWVLDRPNPWQELFSIERKKLRGGLWNYIQENAGFPYHLLKGYIAPSEGDRAEDVGPGEGRILNLNGQRCAVYRSPEGKVQACSAICTHLGCIVNWNEAEATWDCPCHGSRFTPDGKVIAGPAEQALERRDVT